MRGSGGVDPILYEQRTNSRLGGPSWGCIGGVGALLRNILELSCSGPGS